MRQISGSYTSTYLLIVTLAFLVLGATLQVAAFYHDAEVQMRETDYATALEEYNAMNIYYEPDNIAYYVKIRQNPAGYFVLNPDLIFEPSELGKDSMKSTRFAVVTLDKLNQTEQMNGNATVNYVMGNYVNYSIAETSYAGFRMHEGFDPGVRTTCDAVMTLVSLGALDDPELDLDAVERFILAHRNPDGGFWDEDYAQDGMNSTLKCTSFALRALGRIYQHQDRGFSADFKDGVVGFVDSCFDDSDGGYADRPGGESIETYATFRAFISLWWLGGNNDLERRAFVTQNMDLQKSVDYLLDNHYYPETGAFSRYEDKSKGNESLKGTHLMIWFLKDMDMEEKLDINHLGHYIMDHEVLPGQYGEDIYSTYAAVLMLTRLNISTESLPVPEYLPMLPLGYPTFLPLVFIVLGFMALASTYFTERRAMESEKMQREILEKLVEERTKKLGGEVAERRKAEEKLKQYVERMEELVEERTKDLREAQEQLVQKERLAVLGQLGAGIGHELRNPLGAIKNAAYFLRMVFEEPEPEVKDTIDIIENEVATSERIISSLLSYVRPRPPTRRKVDINDIITAALSVVTIPGNVEVVSQLDEGLPTILADPDQFRQVFVNLITNALQAMPRGGRLVVKSWSPKPDSVDVSIADTGVGISQENIPNLFKPLFTTKAKGIGLGLAIVKTLVEGHSGTIDVQSEPDKGTTFTVRIPMVLRRSE